PSLVETSALTGRSALKQFFVSSSISGARALLEENVTSATGKYCFPTEAKTCMWSGKKIHLLNGLRRKADKPELWAKIAEDLSIIANAKAQVEAAILSRVNNIWLSAWKQRTG